MNPEAIRKALEAKRNKKNDIWAQDDTVRYVHGPRWIKRDGSDGYSPELRVIFNGVIIYEPLHWVDGIEFCRENFCDDYIKVDLR